MSTTLARSPLQLSSGNDLERPCLNCGTPLDGPFCAECGQRDLPPEPPLRELIAEAWDMFVSVDGKVAQTIRLLITRPGALTAEYLQGRRARFLPPLRLYLICSVVFFLVEAAAPTRVNRAAVAANKAHVDSAIAAKSPKKRVDDTTFARQLDSLGRTDHNWLWKRLKINGLRVGRDGKNFTADFKSQTPRVLFVLMPAFALLLALVYRSRRRTYAAHLIVSLHLHAFVFAILTAGTLAAWVPFDPVRRIVTLAGALWVLVYVPLALRRVYGGRLMPAVARTAVVTSVYSVVALLAISALAVLLVFFY